MNQLVAHETPTLILKTCTFIAEGAHGHGAEFETGRKYFCECVPVGLPARDSDAVEPEPLIPDATFFRVWPDENDTEYKVFRAATFEKLFSLDVSAEQMTVADLFRTPLSVTETCVYQPTVDYQLEGNFEVGKLYPFEHVEARYAGRYTVSCGDVPEVLEVPRKVSDGYYRVWPSDESTEYEVVSHANFRRFFQIRLANSQS